MIWLWITIAFTAGTITPTLVRSELRAWRRYRWGVRA
jgi:hypothetical protein